ncbi:autotransporter domain-containing protein [Luteimonas vadosa]|uniref:Autotransporter domain-containing protein n=1 Tax=Luteimonas vadosa TaxID=1165507 RepID=A0ABP9DWC9_9GAMM
MNVLIRRFPRLACSLMLVALTLAASPVLAQSAPQTYSRTIVFGDSLSDAGFYRPVLIQQAGPGAAFVGRFTTNPGQVWVEYLAQFYGTSADPAWGLTGTGIVNGTGTNYAAGGARVNLPPGFPPSPPTNAAPPLSAQINAYLAANGGRADPNALYVVWGGPNDLFFHLNGLTTQAQFFATAGQQSGLVTTLQNAGARYVVVPSMPDVGSTPFGLSQGPAGAAGITALVQAYNQALFGGLRQAGLRVIPLDVFNFLREVSASPSTYGLVNVTAPACGAVPSLQCAPNNLVAPGADRSYAFADGVHPTTAGHLLLADLAVSVLEAPRQVAALPYVAATTGRARADRVLSHLDEREPGSGMRWWVDGRLDSQRYSDNDYEGDGPALTVGVDWDLGGVIVGGYLGRGRQRIEWGRLGGDFRQTDTALGALVGWQGEHAWVAGQASVGRLETDVTREVALGPATRVHRGSTDGDSLGVGLATGWNWNHGGLRHGPLLSLLAQRIEIDGYEEDSSQSTALGYPDQRFDSRIASLGWQASVGGGSKVRPYLRLTADREFESPAAEAFARSRSMPGTEPYAVPGLVYDDSYYTLLLGTRASMFGLEADAGLNVTLGHEGGRNTSLFLSVGGNF